MGRPSRGVRGIELREGDHVIGASVVTGNEEVLSVTEFGYGKRTAVEEYREQGRGGLGLINLKVSDKTGPVVAALPVAPDDELVVATKQGMVIRTPVADISQFGRSTQGVRVIRLNEEDAVVSVTQSTAVAP
jgi:DNA gyrase subunit A